MSKKLGLRKRVALELHRHYRHNNAQLHPLRTLFWECTLRCNMNCRHCGSDCRQQASQQDMPVADFIRVVDSLLPHVDPHKTFVVFTGGEALLRSDLEEAGTELYRREMPWGFVSNGLLLDEHRLESLLDAGLHSATISLDGFEQTHNLMRRNAHSFEGAARAIKLLAATPELVWDVVTCVTPNNIGQLKDLHDYLYSIGVRRWRLFSVVPMGRAATNADLQLSNDDFRGLMAFIKECRTQRRVAVNYGCEGFLGSYEGEVRDQLFYCRAGIEVASILCDGSISGCTSIRSNYHQGNIYQDDFWEVWGNRFTPYREHSWMRKGECAECAMFRYCEGSGMHLRDNNGDILFCHLHRLQ
ncbi:MAG: TIGR04133 family radical SAM/SPASM protein [Bacteroidales bacterium]|nr:TIGR04133 family radical SAM/SPASM protein [Bacteroidales bacterium]